MAYDALAESVRLIEAGAVTRRESLTRRRRFLAVGVDVLGDIAGTVLIRRGHGGAEWECHLLSRRPDGWRLHGGGGGGGDRLDVLTHQFTERELGGHGRAISGAGALAESRGLGAAGGRWLQLGVVATTPAVADLVLVDGRVRSRPPHGYFVVVWEGHAPLRGELRDGRGGALSMITLGS